MIVLYWLDPKNKKINMQQIIEDLQYINNISPKIFNKSYHGEVFYVWVSTLDIIPSLGIEPSQAVSRRTDLD